MDLRVLRYFLVVAREENITRAAALLHLTQPTLSRQLMQLEAELGVKLFLRSRYRIILTDDGDGKDGKNYVIHGRRPPSVFQGSVCPSAV